MLSIGKQLPVHQANWPTSMSSIFLLEIVLIRLHPSTVDALFFTEDWGGILLTYMYPLLSLTGAGLFNSPRAVRSRRVPSVGGYQEGGAGRYPLLIGCLSGTVFGGMHCLGWNYMFQGHTIQILWRTASLAIVSAPVCILLLSSYIIWLDDSNDVGVIALLAVLASSFIYIVARATLIVLILMSFRSLPSGAYDTVAWTQFIPHL